MRRSGTTLVVACFWGWGPKLLAQSDGAQPPKMKMTTDIPESITTPDRVETRIGTLEFFDGMPDEDTVEMCYDNLDFLRGVEAFLNGIPATSIEGIRLGQASLGATQPHHCVIFDRLMDSAPLFLTGNTDTVYASLFLDLERDGATVIEIPPKCGPGTVNDAFFRFVVDMGIPGPDAGAGGKYLILPPDDERDIHPPEGGMEAVIKGETYWVARSASYANWLILRGFLVEGKPEAATAMFKNGLRVYPLKDAGNPPRMKFISGSEKPFNTIHANSFEFYEELHTVIEREPVAMLDPELRGLYASIGIQKGEPFTPDERMKKILTDAVAVGNATARSIWLRPRMPDTHIYPDSAWCTGFIGGSHEWLRDGGKGGRYLDARTYFFYMATVNTPAMVKKMVGKGSQYALAYTDEDGNYLDGSKQYRLKIPADVPAKDFWSIVVYDPQTRSQLQTGQPFPAKNSERHQMIANGDGSIDLYFGPRPPAGKEAELDRDGSRQGLVRRSSASTDRSSPGSTRPGGRARSSWSIDRMKESRKATVVMQTITYTKLPRRRTRRRGGIRNHWSFGSDSQIQGRCAIEPDHARKGAYRTPRRTGVQGRHAQRSDGQEDL